MPDRQKLARLVEAIDGARAALNDPDLDAALAEARTAGQGPPGETFEQAWKRLGWKDQLGYERALARAFWTAAGGIE